MAACRSRYQSGSSFLCYRKDKQECLCGISRNILTFSENPKESAKKPQQLLLCVVLNEKMRVRLGAVVEFSRSGFSKKSIKDKSCLDHFVSNIRVPAIMS
jgi:hypothetical protein